MKSVMKSGTGASAYTGKIIMKRIILFVMAAGLFVAVVLRLSYNHDYHVEAGENVQNAANEICKEQEKYSTENQVLLNFKGDNVNNNKSDVMTGQNMEIMASEEFLEGTIGCSVVLYPSGRIMLECNEERIEYKDGRKSSYANGTLVKLKDAPKKINGKLYIPISENIKLLGYSCDYIYAENMVNISEEAEKTNLPEKYDLRKEGRVTEVRDQGENGTCWAFASLGALESDEMPMNKNIYSVDHMSENCGYTLSSGGESTMSIAYLAAWKGPVTDSDYLYSGSNKSVYESAEHVQEALILNDASLYDIKNTIFKYGGVEAPIYMALTYGGKNSKYYNEENAAYYYSGNESANHDVVIVGWDDTYSKDNFTNRPSSDGAFICKNSWGTDFGDDGYFYVSYADSNIGQRCVLYSKIDANNNYDNIYQSDLLGWTGQIGFGDDTAYFANVYTAKSDESIKAVSFYATGKSTSYEVYIVPDFKNVKSFENMIYVCSGSKIYSGYYTVEFSDDTIIKKRQKYAVVVKIQTKGSKKPIAVECSNGDATEDIDLSDGEGYASLNGVKWHRAEDSDCNICLKAFTDNR